MSTNYYLALPGAKEEAKLHVGLSAAGLFRFRAHPNLGLVSFDAWSKHLEQSTGTLVDEYDAPADVAEFLAFVVRDRDDTLAGPRKGEYHNAPLLAENEKPAAGTRWRDAQGFLFHDFEFS